MGKLFGGSKSTETSKSWNEAYPQLNSQLGSTVGQAGNASNAIAAMLGIGGDPAAQNAAFDNFRNSTGYNFLMDQGQQAIMGNKASKGLFRSGSTGQALTKFGTGLADTYYKDYMDQLLGLGGQGLQAAGILGQAGQRSEGSRTQKSKPGLGGLIGTIGAGIATGGGSLAASAAAGA